MIKVKYVLGNDFEVEEVTYNAYCELKEDLRGRGIFFEISSVYGSISQQQEIYR